MNYPGKERRERRRREVDDEQAAIVEHAVHDAPLVHKLIKTGRVAAAVGAFCTLVGGAGGALGYRFVSPNQDLDSVKVHIRRAMAEVDSLKKGYQTNEAKLDILLKLSCLDRRTTEREKQLAGLRCGDVIGP